MHVITFVNEKGGVGKTTLAVHLACGLAARGKKVVVVDGDPQGHATIRLGVRKSPALYDLLVRDAEWTSCVRAVPPERFGIPGHTLPTGKLWIVPSNVETRNINDSIADADTFILRIEELEETKAVDALIIDTSPTPSKLHGAFYSVTQFIIHPTKLTTTSFDGLVESINRRQAADNARARRWGFQPIHTAGIIPVEYRANTDEQRHNFNELVKQFGDLVWRPIPQRTIWTESESRALPVYSLDPASDAAGDAWELVDRMEDLLRVKA